MSVLIYISLFLHHSPSHPLSPSHPHSPSHPLSHMYPFVSKRHCKDTFWGFPFRAVATYAGIVFLLFATAQVYPYKHDIISYILNHIVLYRSISCRERTLYPPPPRIIAHATFIFTHSISCHPLLPIITFSHTQLLLNYLISHLLPWAN